ncbi:C40 family peptidase [Maridesulfovibrio hydrothermalis]|uniref:NLP/P60 protein n=1 Tax=Maridesulfovibrio hydrothermalis AM13 = DSM 14728 TaxID=1121451 RepID=L0R9T8_9BACT|nr:C40 family peptidase [Maridesulfovibrio hydrothermalis]CCO23514.1 NLP/P60 protein [Maridesulfovibrio hydrothermalis AM13 = DSM 14728]
MKQIWPVLFLICLLFFISGCGKKTVSIPHSRYAQNESGTDVARSVVRSARAQIGKPYRWGGASPDEGFDCSGLVWWVYRRHGFNLPRVSWQQLGFGRSVHRSRMQAGDIVFFRIPGQGKSLHTGIYSGNGNFFIHSPKNGHTVREESMEKAYWRKYFIGARRVL